MANNTDNVILSIDVDYGKAIDAIKATKEAIDGLIEENAKLEEQIEQNKEQGKPYDEETDAILRNEAAIRVYKDQLRQLNKEMTNTAKVEKANNEGREDSLNSLRASLSVLTRQYDEMGKAEREGARGKELQKHINDITTELKEAEAETQRYYRNVGNYENAIRNALGANSKWYQSLTMINDITKGGMKQAFQTATTAVSSFGKQLLSLLANPIVATLAAIAGAIGLVVKGIKSSEQNTQQMRVILAPFNRLLEVTLNVIQSIVTWILSWVTNGAKLVGWIMTMMEKLPVVGKLLAYVNKQIRESIAIATEDAQLTRDRRSIDVQNAKDQAEIAKLRKNAADAAKKDRKQQQADLKKIDDLEKGIAKRNVDFAKRDLANAEARAKTTQNQADVEDQLAQKRVAVFQAEAEYYQRTTKVAGQLATAEVALGKEMTATGNIAADTANRVAEAKKKELDAVRSAEDALTRIIRDEYERRRKEIDLQYSRRIEDLNNQLQEEGKTLTAGAREAIRTEIEAVKIEWKQETERWSADMMQNVIEQEQTRLGLLLEAAKDDALKIRELRIAELDAEQQAEEIRITQEVTNEKRRQELLEALRLAYNAKRQAVELEFEKTINEQQIEAISKDFAARIEAAGENELEVARLQAMERQKIMLEAQQMEGESIEAFNERKLQLQRDYNESMKNLAKKEVEINTAKAKAIGQAVGALSDLLDEAEEKNRAAAIASKVLALAEIAISSGVAIAAGIKQSQSVPFPANLAAIASTVAAILAGITSAIKTVKSAKFATGGTVFGVGSATSDSINARLSNGESVMTAEATSLFSPILSAMNQLGGGVPIVSVTPQTQMGEDMIAAAVAKGMLMAPQPVVSVREINDVQNRVQVIETLSKL